MAKKDAEVDALAEWESQVPCKYCGGRPNYNPVTGVHLKDGHTYNCLTRAEPVGPRRPLTDEDVAEIRQRLGPAPVSLDA